jgi:hypothetical protein
METLFGAADIPGDNQIRIPVDGIGPAVFAGVCHENLKTADESGATGAYRVLDGDVLPDLDGFWHYSSKKIHCEHCQNPLMKSFVKKTKTDNEAAMLHSKYCKKLLLNHFYTTKISDNEIILK